MRHNHRILVSIFENLKLAVFKCSTYAFWLLKQKAINVALFIIYLKII
jgi:hypothetical protein